MVSSSELLRTASLSQTQRKVWKRAVHVHLMPARQRMFPSCLWLIKRRSHFLERTRKDEVGRGSFGVFFKGHWAGTEVAKKHIKIRNVKCIQSVLEREVKVHSMLRHPNIAQIMAQSYLKNSILVVHCISRVVTWMN